METLLIQPQEIVENTPLGGNVDVDKYVFVIQDVQVTVIEPLLGNKLYEKIIDLVASNTVAGDYQELLDKYLKPILRHQVFAEYAEIGAYTVANGGIYKHVAQDAEAASKNDIQYLAQTQRTKAQLYIDRAKRWLKDSDIEEYIDRHCGGSNVKVSSGWYL